MGCNSPLEAFRGKDGALVWDKRLSPLQVPLFIPCGQCMGCRLERSRQWAMRCLHEKSLYTESCFATLTYSDLTVPLLHGPLVPVRPCLELRDLQLFMKRVRKRLGNGIRYFGCGEYGGTTLRPHYHVLFFNLSFDDDRKRYNVRSKDPLYTSQELDDLWGLGNCVLGDVTFESCAYVARYCVDKLTGDRAYSHYRGRRPEFAVMSRRPGVGSGWIGKYAGQVFNHDSVVMRGFEMTPPKFYDVRLEALDPERFAKLKSARKRAFQKRKAADLYEFTDKSRARAREVFQLKKQAFFKRGN